MGDMTQEEIMDAAKELYDDFPENAMRLLSIAKEKAIAYKKRSVLCAKVKETSDEVASYINSVQVSRRGSVTASPAATSARESSDEPSEEEYMEDSMSFSVRPVRGNY